MLLTASTREYVSLRQHVPTRTSVVALSSPYALFADTDYSAVLKMISLLRYLQIRAKAKTLELGHAARTGHIVQRRGHHPAPVHAPTADGSIMHISDSV